jgi:hypothetical protein
MHLVWQHPNCGRGTLEALLKEGFVASGLPPWAPTKMPCIEFGRNLCPKRSKRRAREDEERNSSLRFADGQCQQSTLLTE